MKKPHSDAALAASTPDKVEALRISPELIGTVTVTLDALVGQASLTVAQLDALRPGSVVETDAPLNRPVELRLNGVVVARGSLVSIDDRFGVRIGEIVPWSA